MYLYVLWFVLLLESVKPFFVIGCTFLVGLRSFLFPLSLNCSASVGCGVFVTWLMRTVLSTAFCYFYCYKAYVYKMVRPATMEYKFRAVFSCQPVSNSCFARGQFTRT